MKNRIIVLAALIFLVSLACQLFVPTTAREGTVISDCAEIVGAAFVIDLPDLGGARRIAGLGVAVHSLVSFSGH